MPRKWWHLYGAPLLVGALNSRHPIVAPPIYPKIVPHLHWWIHLHLLNLLGFAFLGYAAYSLVCEYKGLAAAISKLAALLFIPLYAGFDALAGIGTGIFAHIAMRVPANQASAIQSAIDYYWSNQIVMILSIAGSIMWGISMLAAAVAFTVPERRWIAAAAAVIIFIVTGWARSSLFYASDQMTIRSVWWLVTAATAIVMFVVCKPSATGGFLTLSGTLFGATHVVPTGPLGMLCFIVAAYSVSRR